MKRILVSIYFLLVVCLGVFAEDVQFVASAPPTVVAGQQFRVAYTVNQEGKDFRAPDMSQFDVLMGPSTSRSSSYQYMNGKASSSMTISYIYILVARKEGTYTLSPGSINVKGDKHTSNSLTIKVFPMDSQGGNQSSSSSSSTRMSRRSAAVPDNSSSISNDQIFVKQTFSKTKVYEQEAILVTYKLYTRYDLRDLSSAQFPDFKGFFSQEIDLNKDRQFTVENYNGTNYNTIILKQYLLYPQRSGYLEVGRGKFEAIVRVKTGVRTQSIFDNFFDTYQEVKKTLTTPSARIEVKALPQGKPKSFNGAVGNFTLQSNISNQNIKVNDALTLKVTISGNGNMKLLKNPEVKFPVDFETYDPKVDNKFKIGTSGTIGSKVIEYLAIPRFGGNFEIPPVEFSYFDLSTNTYKVLTTPAYKFKVSGNGVAANSVATTYNNQENVKMVGKDIRFINNDNFELNIKDDFIFGSITFWLGFILPSLLFIVVVLALHKQAKENANIALTRTKRANRLAKKRLSLADKYLKKGDEVAFYEETMKALWGYLGEKLNIPNAVLLKENVQTELLQHGATEDLISEFLDLLTACEYARFSPANNEELTMDKIFMRAINVISVLENNLK